MRAHPHAEPDVPGRSRETCVPDRGRRRARGRADGADGVER
ncbi:hypothetical protein ACFPM0_25855 [Pseudonocardia sulfidoxydans]